MFLKLRDIEKEPMGIELSFLKHGHGAKSTAATG